MRFDIRQMESEEAAWNAFVSRFETATVYHDARWKRIIERTFGHDCHYLCAYEDGEIAGVLPLVEMNSALFGHFLVSLPFVTYGGMLASNSGAENALAAAATRLAVARGARHVELRQSDASSIPWASRQHKVALVVPLAGAAGEYWSSLGSRLRGKVRKAERTGTSFQVLGADGLEQFYSVFSRNMRELGTPVYPKSFFGNILESFPSSSWIFLAQAGGRPVATALGLRNRTELHLPWIASDYAFSKNYVNEFLYWSTLEWAFSQGFERLDLGRSTAGGGNHQFKLQWKPEEKPLHWYCWMANGGAAPELSPNNPRYAFAIRCWRRLPLSVANWLGPKIVRNIP